MREQRLRFADTSPSTSYAYKEVQFIILLSMHWLDRFAQESKDSSLSDVNCFFGTITRTLGNRLFPAGHHKHMQEERRKR